jgi:hypothetical protein
MVTLVNQKQLNIAHAVGLLRQSALHARTKEERGNKMSKNKIVENRPSYCVSAASHASWLRRIGQKARKQRSDAGKKRK